LHRSWAATLNETGRACAHAADRSSRTVTVTRGRWRRTSREQRACASTTVSVPGVAASPRSRRSLDALLVDRQRLECAHASARRWQRSGNYGDGMSDELTPFAINVAEGAL